MASFDIYAAVTDRIIAEMEKGIIPWAKPWGGTFDRAISHSTGKPYSLINQLFLGESGEYITFKQCEAEGGRVKKGAKSKFVVFWKIMHHEKKDANGAIIRDANGLPVDDPQPVLRYFNVFAISDCEGIKPKYTKEYVPSTASPIEKAEAVIADYASRAKLTIEHSKQNEAFYAPRVHRVSLPLMEQFETAEGYYDTTFHELTHSTGHKTLLNRFTGADEYAAFGSASYSKEELVAEIGACTIMNRLGMETEKTFRNNVAYIQSWLQALKNDKRMIVSAAGRAEKAVKLILGETDSNVEE